MSGAANNAINRRGRRLPSARGEGLASTTASRRVSKGGRRKAAEMAEQEIDRLSDQTATNEERARRKRRLLKGPREFRDLRPDLAKIKG
jgi:hypothetical protein